MVKVPQTAVVAAQRGTLAAALDVKLQAVKAHSPVLLGAMDRRDQVSDHRVVECAGESLPFRFERDHARLFAWFGLLVEF